MRSSASAFSCVPARAELAVQLRLVEVVELAVVVEQATDTQLRGANVGPGPWMIRNQNGEREPPTTPTLIAKMRSRAPRSCAVARRAADELPGVVDALAGRHRDHQRREQPSERRS